jgi:hypothetical protein
MRSSKNVWDKRKLFNVDNYNLVRSFTVFALGELSTWPLLTKRPNPFTVRCFRRTAPQGVGWRSEDNQEPSSSILSLVSRWGLSTFSWTTDATFKLISLSCTCRSCCWTAFEEKCVLVCWRVARKQAYYVKKVCWVSSFVFTTFFIPQKGRNASFGFWL